MIRTLQWKFVATAMIAITGLILVLLGAINIINFAIVSGRLDHTLEMLGRTGGDIGQLPPMQPQPFREAPSELRDMGPNDYDTFMASNYFVVRFDLEGTVVFVDVSRTSQVTKEEARALAESVYREESERGEKGCFRYLMKESPAHTGVSIVFLDTSVEILSYIRVLFLSVGAGLVSWVLMLLCVILLSKKAIRPIAENVERQKQFVTNAGHEIKTPVAIIQSNTEALELYNGESKWSKNIKEQTVRLSRLVNDLLFLARIDEETMQAHPTNFFFDALIIQMLEEFSYLIKGKDLQVSKSIKAGTTLWADKNQIRQALSILLDNSIKYADQGGSLEIRLYGEKGQATLQIQNTCASLPEAPPDKLFERFYRDDTARTQKSGGYGIGLAAVQSIVQMNKGSVSAQYIQPNIVRLTVRFYKKKEGPHANAQPAD